MRGEELQWVAQKWRGERYCSYEGKQGSAVKGEVYRVLTSEEGGREGGGRGRFVLRDKVWTSNTEREWRLEADGHNVVK